MSIIVTNHNYADFLPAALSSAVNQDAENLEIIVVDDGSTDSSGDVLASYGDAIAVLHQRRQGQKAAFNTGFVAASGDVVVFLDADDTLVPGVARRVQAAFAAQPDAARAVYRLMVIDERGRPTGALQPSPEKELPDGDVRPFVLAFPDDVPWPPTSGNAFAHWVLDILLPLPVDDQLGADVELHSLAPLFGPVIALDGIGGCYRVHERNGHARRAFDVARSRAILRWSIGAHERLRGLALDLGYGVVDPQSVTFSAHRLASVRIGGADHPIEHDRRWHAALAGARAGLARRDAGAVRRAVYVSWFLLAAVAPRSAVPLLVDLAFGATRHGASRR